MLRFGRSEVYDDKDPVLRSTRLLVAGTRRLELRRLRSGRLELRMTGPAGRSKVLEEFPRGGRGFMVERGGAWSSVRAGQLRGFLRAIGFTVPLNWFGLGRGPGKAGGAPAATLRSSRRILLGISVHGGEPEVVAMLEGRYGPLARLDVADNPLRRSGKAFRWEFDWNGYAWFGKHARRETFPATRASLRAAMAALRGMGLDPAVAAAAFANCAADFS